VIRSRPQVAVGLNPPISPMDKPNDTIKEHSGIWALLLLDLPVGNFGVRAGECKVRITGHGKAQTLYQSRQCTAANGLEPKGL